MFCPGVNSADNDAGKRIRRQDIAIPVDHNGRHQKLIDHFGERVARDFRILGITCGRGGQVVQILRGSGVEPKGPRQRVHHLSGRTGRPALLESQVVSRADARQCCQLLAAQSCNAPPLPCDQPDFFGTEIGRLFDASDAEWAQPVEPAVPRCGPVKKPAAAPGRGGVREY